MPVAPSIINSLIAMGMWQEDPDAMLGESLPRKLMLLTMLTVPWMLIPKPIILLMQHRAKQAKKSNPYSPGPVARTLGKLKRPAPGAHVPLDDVLDMEEDNEAQDNATLSLKPKADDEDEDDDFEFGEICIHQIIETIEYVLGTVSHTASYLRLWALSLAHQQLSSVFFGMFIVSGMALSFPLNSIALVINFAIWFVVTLAVLLGMDVLECFLHTLRLHWVEFQSKFYKADGHAFAPFRHRILLEETER